MQGSIRYWVIKMRLTPISPTIPEIGGFTTDNDIFEYRDFGERLSNLVDNIDEPLVIVLDGPWGSGKSVFIRQWAGQLRNRGASVILFDAFGHDHYEDAFLALAAQIHNAAKSALGGNNRTARRFLNRAKRVGALLAPIAARVAARATTAGLLSTDDLEAGGEAIKAAAEAAGNEAEKAVERVVSELLRKAGEDKAALDAFRETLGEVARALSNAQNDKERGHPLVFIIDELDRCRPPFALSVIERIKHLFSVDGVCFVLVSSLPQLEQAVQGAYGVTFDARTYLEKFYQLRVFLPQGRNEREGKISQYIAHLWRTLGIRFPDERHGELVRHELEALAEGYNLSLRQLERAITNIVLAKAAAGPRQRIHSAGRCRS